MKAHACHIAQNTGTNNQRICKIDGATTIIGTNVMLGNIAYFNFKELTNDMASILIDLHAIIELFLQ